MKRAKIRRLGEHGNRVLLFEQGHLATVQWRDKTRRLRTQSFPKALYSTEALAFARGCVLGQSETDVPAAPRVTLRQIWNAYSLTEFPHLRDSTQQKYADEWAKWETMFGKDFNVDDTTKMMMPEFVAALRKQGLAITTIKNIVRTVQMVYSWGEETLDTRNRVHTFKLKAHKDERREAPAEYRPEEWDRMVATLDPESLTEWRGWVALTICGQQGARQNAVLHLRWRDISVLNGGRIFWRAEWDKTGREWSQPIREGTRRALEVAMKHRVKDADPAEDWVIPSGRRDHKGQPFAIQSLWAALIKAEKNAGVNHLRGRGGHGARRMVAGDVMAKTKDPGLATAAINDSIAQAPRYIKKREEAVDAAILQLDEVQS